MVDQKVADQRKKLRSPILVLKVRVEEEGAGKVFFGYARNISRSGLFIATANPRSPGSRFNVALTPPPTGEEIQCACEVVWKREFSRKSPYEPGMGLRFIDLPEDVALQIDSWVKKQNELEEGTGAKK